MKKPSSYFFIFFCFLSAVILRVLYLITPLLDSDYANIGLAARHILKGEFPLFFYGDYFEGVIEGYLAAPLFWLFGSSRLVLDCVPAFMSLILIFAVYKLAKELYGYATANLSLLFSSIAPSFFLLASTVPLEGYIETAIIAAFTFIIAHRIIYIKKNLPKLYFLLGILIGFALYLQYHIVPFAITIGICLLLDDKTFFFKKPFIFAVIGFLIGNSPFIIFNLTHQFATFRQIGRGLSDSSFSGTMEHFFCHGLWIILGIKNEFRTNHLPLLAPAIYLIYIASFICILIPRSRTKGIKKYDGSEFIIILFLVFPITYWLSGRGTLDTRRYLIPLFSVLPIIPAYGINFLKQKNRLAAYGIVCLILFSNLYSNYKSIPLFNRDTLLKYNSEIKQEKELYTFLKANNIKGVYALSWWDSIKFNFEFKEKIIFCLMQNEPYPKYRKIVDSETSPAVLDHFSEFTPSLDSICKSYNSYYIPSPIGSSYSFSIHYDFVPRTNSLEEIDNTNWSSFGEKQNINAGFAFDRKINTYWNADGTQTNGMFFAIDLGKIYRNLTRLTYNPGISLDWPLGYELYSSINGNDWECIAKNPAFAMPLFWSGPHPFIKTVNGFVEIDFPPHPARYIKLVLTKDKKDARWTITELFLYNQKNPPAKQNWEISGLLSRILQLNPNKVFADPWVSSHLPEKYYPLEFNETAYDFYIYRHFIIKKNHIKNSIFVVPNENYPSFVKQCEGMTFISEDFGPYKLIYFDEKNNNPDTLYWDGFHLLKIAE